MTTEQKVVMLAVSVAIHNEAIDCMESAHKDQFANADTLYLVSQILNSLGKRIAQAAKEDCTGL